MKRRFRLKTVLLSMLLIVFAGGASIYWQIRNVDPEGACRDSANLSRCFDAWAEYNYGGLFKKLPTDQELIDRFQSYRGDFEEIKNMSIPGGFVPDSLQKRTGVWYAGARGYWPATVYSEPSKSHDDHKQWYARYFPVTATMYIDGAGKNWPKVNREKGYVYFPLPAPKIENGHVVGLTGKDGRKYSSWRVLDQLDKDWPADWRSGECLLRRIEPQWFLALCKDRIGG